MKTLVKNLFGRVLLTALCLLIQILWIMGFVWKLNQYYVWFSVLQQILALVAVLRINAKSEYSTARLVWTIVILSFPVFGFLLYFMFGRNDLNKATRLKYEKIMKQYGPALIQDSALKDRIKSENIYVHNQQQYIFSAGGYPFYQNTAVTYFSQTDTAFTSLLSDLADAKEFIFMEYFAVEDGEIFKQIEEILLQKVAEGVEVRFLYDDFGSIGYVNPRFAQRLNKEGIQCKIFNPLVPILYIFMNHRDHRKITVIDNRISYSGGFNLADEYFNINSPYGHWKDTGIRLEGEAVRSHTVMFLEMWNFISASDKNFQKYLPCHSLPSQGSVQPYSDTPLDQITLGENVYLNILKNAAHYVYLITPYLILDNETEKELCLAAQRGIDVRIITPGIPDKKLVYLATQSYYAPLIKAGVKIYQYTPGFCHAKTYVCDDQIAVVGTINMDYRSLYLHFECASYLYRCEAVDDIVQDFAKTFPLCQEIGMDYCKGRSLFTRMLQCVLRLFAPLL